LTTGLIVLPEGVMFNESATPGSRIALAPDGSALLFHGRYISDGRPQVFLQRLDGTPATPLPDARNLVGFFWTPDSRAVMAFTTDSLERFALDGSKPVTVTTEIKNAYTGGAINAAGDVLVGGNSLRLFHLSTGAVEVIREGPGLLYGLPEFFEDGRQFLYGQVATSGGEVSVFTSRLGSTESTLLMSGPDIRRSIPVSGGLIFAKGGTLYAQRMSGSPPTLTGEPVTIAQSLDMLASRGQAITASANGVLAFIAESARSLSRLTWYDRRGNLLTTIGDDSNYSNLELSPDGRQLLLSATDQRSEMRDVYIVDVNRGVRRRFTTDPSDERSAVWSPDGTRVIYTSRNLNFYTRSADSSGPERELFMEPSNKDPYDWSQDGRWLLYRKLGPASNDLWIMPSNGPGPGKPIADSRFNESSGNFSPDGRHVVYTSDESGQTDVYVVNTDGGGKTQISTKGGLFPRWSRDGKEIFYVSIDRMLTSVDVLDGSSFQVSAPHALFPINVAPLGGAAYDVGPDGQRFIVATPVPPRVPPALTIMTNWQRMLKLGTRD
jgi:Tol biopolymer transport system component